MYPVDSAAYPPFQQLGPDIQETTSINDFR